MASKTLRKLLIGRKSQHTNWGIKGCSHSIHNGGYNNYIYGIKGIIAIQIYHGWGDYHEETLK